MNATKQVQVVTTDKAEGCGAVVFWTLSRSADLARMVTALAAEPLLSGIQNPSPVSDLMALRRAAESMRPAEALVRPVENGIAVVFEKREGITLSYRTFYAAQVLPGVLEGDPPRVVVTPSHHAIAETMPTVWEGAKQCLEANDVSVWLINHVLQHLDAVSLRQRGGFYFVPATHVETYRALARALGSVSDAILYEIPAMTSDSAVEAILGAVSREAEALADEFEVLLDQGELSAKAAARKAKEVKAMSAKVLRYTELLGAKADDLSERLKLLERGLTLQTIQATAPAAAPTPTP